VRAVPKVRIHGHRRKRKPEGSADLNALAGLMYMATITPEERLDFIWSHPELEKMNIGPSTATTEGQRKWLPGIYLEHDDLRE